MTGPDQSEVFTIIIIDTHPVIRKALAVLLREHFKETRLIEAKNIDELNVSDFHDGKTIFIVVINSDFEEDGTNPIAELKGRYADSALILFGEDIKPELVISYFKSGVNGYLSKHQDLNEMITCINSVSSGKRYLNARYMEIVLEYLIENYRSSKKQDLLTLRQQEVARYLIQGLTTSAIAEKTGLHMSTISTFKTAIFSKLGIDNILKLKQIFEADEI